MCKARGPWTPTAPTHSMSAVRLGPVMRVVKDAHKKPQDSTYCQAGVAVHAGGEHIARAHKTTVEKGQGRSHHENQSGADKYEGVVYRVHGTLPYNLRFKIQMAIRGKIANPYLPLLKHRVCQNASFFFVDAKSS